MIGRTLGNYEITAELGRGGMGEVYRARDTRLNREVAIKVLPAGIAQDPDTQTRFRREAQTISSLNHPNICVLHDVGEQEGIHYLVMELVDGITLTQALRKGPLPIADVFRYGAQVADALDRAHRAGVIHRDLKPGNVMVTKQGAKLMDFGLARVAPSSQTPEATVALSHEALTAEGAIVGTFQYMAPEQLEGREVDQRSDLWALGCVLYEMATGERAFAGATQASLIGSIMHAQPAPVSERIDLSPQEFDRLVQACLAKDPEDRVQSAHDIKLQLKWLAEGSSSSFVAPAIPTRRRGARWPLVAALAFLLGAVGVWFAKPAPGPAPALAQRYDLGSWPLNFSSTPVIAPDGRSVVFSVDAGGEREIHRRSLESLTSTLITGTRGGTGPFFSPDGQWLGFITRSGIEKVPADGGVPQRICAISSITSADWGDDGNVYLGSDGGGPEGNVAIYRVNGDGGSPEVFAMLEGNESTVWLPEVLPGSRTVLGTVLGGGSRVVAFHADGSRDVVLSSVFEGRYVEPGMLLYRDDENEAAMAIRFDKQTMRTSGSPVAITEPVHANFCFDVSADLLAYVPAPISQDKSEVVWVGRDGAIQKISDVRGSWAQPRVSPDGTKVIARQTGAYCELWVFDLERGSLSRLTSGDDSHNPVWSPDSRYVLYDAAEAGMLRKVRVGGPREIVDLQAGTERGNPCSWAQDLLAFTRSGPSGELDVWVRDMETGDETLVAGSDRAENRPSISADGRWIAYSSEETGRSEVYVRALPDDGSAWQVSVDGGSDPLWSRDGSELYFVRTSDRMIMVSRVDRTDQVSFSIPGALMESQMVRTNLLDYDVNAAGRFVMIQGLGTAQEFRMRIVINWQELVRGLLEDAR